VDYVKRIGRSRGNRPTLVKFITIFKKLEVLKNTNKLAGSRIRVEQNYAREVREIRRELIPYLKDARSRGHKAIMKKNKLIVNGTIYSLEELKEETEPVMRSGSVDNPNGEKRQEEEMIQQGTDNRDLRVATGE
jgi:hypothetical protein